MPGEARYAAGATFNLNGESLVFVEPRNVVYNQTFIDALLGAISTRPAAALAPTLTVALFTDPNVNPQPQSALAVYTASEANFSGYARQTLTLTGPVNLTSVIQALIGLVLYTLTTATPVVGNTLAGFVLVNGSDWLCAGKFDPANLPQLGSVGDFLSMAVAVPLTPNQDVV